MDFQTMTKNMFKLDDAIKKWRREMAQAGVRGEEVLDELENHLREQVAQLINSGVTEEEAFQSASAQLGEGRLLQMEFAKAERERWGNWRDNPIALNVLAGWFMFVGLNAASNLPFFAKQFFVINDGHYDAGSKVFSMAMLLVLSSQMAIGLGLFLRRGRARTVALGWARMSVALFLCGLIAASFYHQPSIWDRTSLGFCIKIMGADSSLRYEFLGTSLPIIFLPIISFLNLGLLIWACYFLTRPPVRDCFSETGRTKSA
jgi:hypothetical protein